MVKDSIGEETKYYKVHAISTRISVSFCLMIGLLIFCRGFLLNRKITTEKSENCTHQNCYIDFGFTKAILVLVDALRHDFVGRMTFLSSLLESSDNNGSCPFKFVADPPTTTMQRLKALMTGTMPTFIDVSANFNSYEIDEDNLIYQLFHAGYNLGFLGDDTWLNLFPIKYFKSFAEGHPSFNAWDLDSVDSAINSSLYSIFSNSSKHEVWDILIAHYLGIDHCGHRYGPSHHEMNRKLNEIDTAVQFIYNSMSNDTLLIVFGDHGMTATGDHGGDSSNEVETLIVFLSKTNVFKCESSIHRLQSVAQIDMVPTLACLLNIPIPFSSVGQVIPLFSNDVFSEVLFKNVMQVHRYIEANPIIENPSLLVMEYHGVLQAYQQHKLSKNSLTQDQLHRLSLFYLDHVKRIATSAWTQFDNLLITLGFFVCVWSIAALFTCFYQQSHYFSFWTQVSNYLPLLSIVVCTFGSLFLQKFGILCIVGFISGALIVFVVMNAAYKLKRRSDLLYYKKKCPERISTLKEAWLLFLYLMTCATVFSNSFVINEGVTIGFSLLSLSLYQCLFGETTNIRNLVNSEGKPERKENIKNLSGIWYSWLGFVCLLLIVRVSESFFRCREELPNCTEEFLLHKNLSSLPDDWIVHKYIRYSVALISLAVLVVSLRSWMLGRKSLLSSRPSALIGKYVPSILVVLLCVYWALQGLPLGNSMHMQIKQLLHCFPSVFEIIAISSLAVIWWKPLCCVGSIRSRKTEFKISGENIYRDVSKCENDESGSSLEVSHQNEEVKLKLFETFSQAEIIAARSGKIHPKEVEKDSILELDEVSNDVYSSSLLVFGSIVTLLLVHITSIGFTPAMTLIPFAAASIAIMHEKFANSSSWSSLISWTLASQFFFYATGHQPMFSSIPWDSAFIFEDGIDFSDGMYLQIGNWVRPIVSVFGNIYASQILFSSFLPLLVVWKETVPNKFKYKLRTKDLLNLVTKFMILNGLKVVVCMACVTLHRRHLMVWKIFTPKFIFEGISFIIIYITCFVSVLFILRVEFKLRNALNNKVEWLSYGLKNS